MAGTHLDGGLSLEQSIKRLHERSLHARDLAEWAIDAHLPSLRAYACWTPERLRTQAQAADIDFDTGIWRGPLQGIPISIKDNIGLTGWPTLAGSEKALPPPWQQDGPLMARLRNQHAVFTGKTQTVAFAFTSLGTTPRGEGPRNPWNPLRVCGGSSSGAAVSVAEGSTLLAVGTDTAGSVRVPASMTGVVGLKMTHGRWPTGSVVPLSHSLDSMGLLGRSVADVATGVAALEGVTRNALLEGGASSLRGLRIGLPKGELWEACEPGITDATWQALRELEAAGARLVDFDFPQAQAADALFRTGGVVGTELQLFLALQLPAWLERLEPELAAAITLAGKLPVETYRERLSHMFQLAAQADERLAEVDVIAMPTVPITPPLFSEVADPQNFFDADAKILRHTAFINYLRLCALTLPVGHDAAGMPVGLQLAARGFDESRLLRIALDVERRLGRPATTINRRQ